MVVLVIIGILVSVFTLSMGSFSDDQTTEHTRRLQTLIELALEDATMQGRELGLHVYQHGYEFSTQEASVDEEGAIVWNWVPLDEDRLLRPRELGEEFSLDLLIENKEVDLEYERPDADEYEPQVFLLSSGDLNPPFRVRLRPSYSAAALLLSVDADGVIEVTSDDF